MCDRTHQYLVDIIDAVAVVLPHPAKQVRVSVLDSGGVYCARTVVPHGNGKGLDIQVPVPVFNALVSVTCY